MILPEESPASPAKNQRQQPQAEPENPPPPSYPGHEPLPSHGVPQPGPSASQPLYVPSPAALPMRHVEPAGKRFLRAFLVAVLVWVLLGMITRSIYDVAGYVHRRKGCPECVSSGPISRDGKQIHCLHGPADWTYEDGRAHATFDLPLSADALYIFSRGIQSAGKVIIIQDGRVHDTEKIHVDVAALYQTPNYLDVLSVCSLERSPGQASIGIFTPRSFPVYHRFPTLDFEVTVRLPKFSESRPLRIPALETALYNFDHIIGDLVDRVFFESLSFQTTNGRIGVQSVNASSISIRTSNNEISGNFEASVLDVSTSNSRIDINAILRSNARHSRSSAIIKSANGEIISSMTLLSSHKDELGGVFDIDTGTTNARLTMDFLAAPVDSVLSLKARTTNSGAFVTLHPTYEGKFRAQTTLSPAEIDVRRDVDDPSGRGRRRSVTRTGTSGKVVWDGEHMGNVDVRSTIGPVTLRV